MAPTTATSKDVRATHERLQIAFRSNKSRSYNWRISQLRAMRRLVTENEAMIAAALKKDLNRCEFEGIVLDLLAVIGELDLLISELDGWMQPEAVPVPTVMLPATSEVISEPYGVCLVIGPFNYPFTLVLSSLAGAICAGNCVLLKPSELAVACEQVLHQLIPRYLDTECIALLCGGIETSHALLNDVKWDKIFFTGSVRVGKIVMKAAAETLTPVTLELGGKSPTIIDESVQNLELAAKRIMWGKCANAGQTCIAPDFVLCHAKHYDAFVQLCAAKVDQFYGTDPQKSPDFCRIINKASTSRLQHLLNTNPGKIIKGGQVDLDTCYVAPTIVTDVVTSSPLMTEEIFGPILPVLKYSTIDEAIAMLQKMDKPLALYIFGKSRKNIDKFMFNVPSGGVTVNDVIIHTANPHLPFGGVGTSGMGAYHGKYSYQCFSHSRAVLRRHDASITDVTARYPPFNAIKLMVYKYGFMVPTLPLLRKLLFPLLLMGATWSLSRWWYTGGSITVPSIFQSK